MVFETRIGVMFLKLLFHAFLFTVSARTNIDGVRLLEDINVKIIEPSLTKLQQTLLELDSPQSEINYFELETAKPKHYDISIIMHHKIFNGISIIRLEIPNKTRTICFHALDLHIPEEKILLTSNDKAQVYRPETSHYRKHKETMILNFNKELPPGSYNLSIKFRGHLSTNFFVMEETDKLGYTKLSYLNLLIPGYSRRVFPCWDLPQYLSTFNITIVSPSERSVLSSMEPRTRLRSFTKRITRSNFHNTPLTPAYLVSIAAVDLSQVSDTYHSLEIWCRSKKIFQVFLAQSIFDKMNKFFFWYFNALQRMSIMNIVVIPGFPLASMGSYGYLVFREKDVTYETGVDFPGRKVAITSKIGTEIARQWFDSYVGPSTWTVSLINNALALYYGYYPVNEIYEDWRMMDLYVVQVLQPTLHTDVGSFMKPIKENPDIFFLPLLIKKVSTLIRMIHQIVESPDLRQSIIDFMSKYKMQFVTPYDLINTVHETYHQSKDQKSIKYNIMEIMETYLSQTSFPVLRVDRNYATGKVSAKQNVSLWNVPITYTTQLELDFHNTTPKTILTKEEMMLHHSNGLDPLNWIIVNIQQTGYYRVNYDNKNWLLIARYLNSEDYTKIHVLNRAQIIDDAFYFLLMDNSVEYATFLELIRYFVRETDYIPWHSMINILWYISPYFDYPESQFIKVHLLGILDGLLKNVGYDENPDDNNMRKALRLLGTKWACKLGHFECRRMANLKLTEHFNNPKAHPIPPWWKDWTYCGGLMSAEEKTWYRLETILTDHNRTEDVKYMSCAKDDDIIAMYLCSIWLPNNKLWTMVGNRQRNTLFISVLKKHAIQDKVLDIVFKNIDKIRQSGLSKLETYIHLIMSLYSKHSLNKLHKFVKEHEHKEPKIVAEVERVISFRLFYMTRQRDRFQKRI